MTRTSAAIARGQGSAGRGVDTRVSATPLELREASSGLRAKVRFSPITGRTNVSKGRQPAERLRQQRGLRSVCREEKGKSAHSFLGRSSASLCEDACTGEAGVARSSRRLALRSVWDKRAGGPSGWRVKPHARRTAAPIAKKGRAWEARPLAY